VTNTTGTYDEMQQSCFDHNPSGFLAVPFTSEEREEKVALVQASPHGDVPFWVGYKLPANSNPAHENNYNGENSKTMAEVGYWQWDR
jgi:hypothetical protein